MVLPLKWQTLLLELYEDNKKYLDKYKKEEWVLMQQIKIGPYF